MKHNTKIIFSLFSVVEKRSRGEEKSCATADKSIRLSRFFFILCFLLFRGTFFLVFFYNIDVLLFNRINAKNLLLLILIVLVDKAVA